MLYITPNFFISMSRTFSFNLSGSEIRESCDNYEINENKIHLKAKEIFLQGKKPKKSERKTNKPENMIVEESLQQIKKKIPEMSTEEIEMALNIGKEKHNHVDRQGLYVENNIEVYLKKFLREWDHNINKIEECRAQLKIYEAEELLMTEYTERINNV